VPSRQDSISLHTKCAQAKDRVARASERESLAETERLRSQVEYVANVRTTESFAQTKKRLRAQTAYQVPHVTTIKATESSVQAKERLKAQVAYQIPQVAAVASLIQTKKKLRAQVAYQALQVFLVESLT